MASLSKYWNSDFGDEQMEENEEEHNEVQHQAPAPTVKPALVRKIKKTYKVKRFKSEWLGNHLDGVQVKTWLVADPADPKQAKCTICPAPADSPFPGRTFSIAEGFSAIRSHSKTKIHQTASEDPNQNNIIEQMTADQGFRNQEEISKQDRKEQENILLGQISFSNMLHHQGLPSSLFACFAKLAPTLFPDSNIAKKWASGGKSGFCATKGDYSLTHGIYPHQVQKLVNILKTSFFSINFDETSINGEI